jgi:selenide, water dikinase
VLRYLPPIVDPNVLIGTDRPDDAAVYRLSADRALVATVDYFTPIVDDPYDFGRIAAANALSDVYAMGARPLFALSIVGFPRDTLPLSVLGEILRGGADMAADAAIFVIGGHSIDDAEPKYGLVVLGEVHPDRIVTKAGARPGDRLFLTKPLGIGIISTGIKRGKVRPDVIREAVAVMTTLNAAAAEAMTSVRPSAGTDVTGFGLLGHLNELASQSGVGARVYLDRVPVLSAAWGLAREGIVPGGTRRNLAFLADRVRWSSGLDEVEQLVLADAQTSGGLLIAVPVERAEALRAALSARGTLAVAEIGEIVPGDGIEVLRS